MDLLKITTYLKQLPLALCFLHCSVVPVIIGPNSRLLTIFDHDEEKHQILTFNHLTLANA